MDPVSKARAAGNSGKTEGRKVPVGRRFQPGVSGNPSGRPKKKPITEIYEELLSDPKVREAIKQNKIKILTSKGMAAVLEGREMAERTEGKVKDELRIELRELPDDELKARLRALLNADAGTTGTDD